MQLRRNGASVQRKQAKEAQNTHTSVVTDRAACSGGCAERCVGHQARIARPPSLQLLPRHICTLPSTEPLQFLATTTQSRPLKPALCISPLLCTSYGMVREWATPSGAVLCQAP